LGAGFTVLASRYAWADTSREELPTRSKPAQSITLKSSQLEVVLDRKDALPYEYRLLPGGIRMRGEDFGKPIQAVICNRERWEFPTLPVTVSSVHATKSQADFRVEVRDGEKPAASALLRYRLDEATVHITLEVVREFAGYELIQFDLPCLVSVREEDGNAWLAHGDSGGSFAYLKDATAAHLPPNRFWGNVAATLPVVMLGTDQASCVQEVTSFMDGTELAAVGNPGQRRACMGTIQAHRVNGKLCYDMNTGTSETLDCGNRNTPNLLIEQKPSCRLDFLAASDAQAPWLPGAKLVRSRIPAIRTHYYDRKLVYGIRCDEPHFEKPGATFAECEELIKTVAALTGNWPQVVHLWGWQYRGKDTGYPAVAEVNKRLGSYDDLMHLMERARQYNCTVTFSDNYDDAYKSSPAWDTKYIARRPDGQLWESRNWTGENSYIIGLAKYMKGPGVDRVRYTCEHYKLRDTTHVDVLAYYPIRNDWDPDAPASGIKNLFEGRYKVLEEFAKHGVDVSSEALRYAFLGKISYFWNAPNPTSCPFGGKPIPLVSTIYRHSAIWGDGGHGHSKDERILNMLFYNSSQHPAMGNKSQYADINDIFYLMMVPWFTIFNRELESFRRDGDRTVIGLEGNYTLDLDWAKQMYSVACDGVELARNGSTTCPLDADRIAFYATENKELSTPLPKNWRADGIRAQLLNATGAQAYEATVTSGMIKVSVQARQPVIVSRAANAS
jgi:hypothetical protein